MTSSLILSSKLLWLVRTLVGTDPPRQDKLPRTFKTNWHGTLNSQRSVIQVPEVLTTKHSYLYTPLMEHNRTRRERILAKGSTKMDRKDMELASTYESFSDLGEIRVWLRADFQSGSRVLKKVFWTFSYLYLWHTMWFHAKKLLRTLKFWKSLREASG